MFILNFAAARLTSREFANNVAKKMQPRFANVNMIKTPAVPCRNQHWENQADDEVCQPSHGCTNGVESCFNCCGNISDSSNQVVGLTKPC